MRGITEEELEEYKNACVFPEWVINELLVECKELNPWQAIDENTPKDRELHLYQRDIGQWIDYNTERKGFIKPTHWQELPEDPK